MKTLTITEAKKNLGVWLKAAARGELVAILSGADVIALRKVEIEAVDCSYAAAEYGVTPAELCRQFGETSLELAFLRCIRTDAAALSA